MFGDITGGNGWRLEAGRAVKWNVDMYPSKPGPVQEIADKQAKKLGLKECQTCKSRRYVDVSDDPGVSFKTPTYIPAGMSGVAVARHENEHVVRGKARAEREGKEVVGISVNFIIGTCPECGRTYVAGGITRVVTVPKLDKGKTQQLVEGVGKEDSNEIR